jgi:hypothetical protein
MAPSVLKEHRTFEMSGTILLSDGRVTSQKNRVLNHTAVKTSGFKRLLLVYGLLKCQISAMARPLFNLNANCRTVVPLPLLDGKGICLMGQHCPILHLKFN